MENTEFKVFQRRTARVGWFELSEGTFVFESHCLISLVVEAMNVVEIIQREKRNI